MPSQEGASGAVFDKELTTAPRVKGYKQIKLLGRGASSAVYLAEQLTLSKRVAIKQLHSGLASDPRALSRFENEARALSNLQHPNLVSVFDLGTTDDGSPYIVMEYAEGTDLKKLIADTGGIDPKRVVHITSQLCDALSCAHENQIIHRDLKPENIILVRDWEGKELVKLVDFGIATPSAQGGEIQRLTQTGELIGSPNYMSPEQIRGGELDQRSDIYSLGCIMYEALTGRQPLRGESILSTLTLHLEEMPKPLEQIKPQLAAHAELSQLVLKCLAKDKDARVGSAGELKNALANLKSNAVEKKPDRLRSVAIIVGAVLLIVNCSLFVWNQKKADNQVDRGKTVSGETKTTDKQTSALPMVPLPRSAPSVTAVDTTAALAYSQILSYFDHDKAEVTNYETALASAIKTHAPVKTQLALSVFLAESYKTETAAKWENLYRRLEPAIDTVTKSDSKDTDSLFAAYFLWYYGYYQVWPEKESPNPHKELTVETAIGHFNDAIALAKRRQSIDSNELIEHIYNDKGEAYESIGDFVQAAQSYKRSCDLLNKTGGLTSDYMMSVAQRLADASISLDAQKMDTASKTKYLKVARVMVKNVISAHPHPVDATEVDKRKKLSEALDKLDALLTR